MSFQPYRYTFVSRVGKTFDGKAEWVYWCGCDNTRSKFVDGLSSEITGHGSSSSAINDHYPECVHISAVRDIVEEEVDTVFGLTADDEFAGK